MKIAITSGKGGVGKTFVATNLAVAMDCDLTYIDCDVEAANAHLFLQPYGVISKDEHLNCITSIDSTKCTACGKCAEFCHYNALMIASKVQLAFPELCRFCKGCLELCPHDALVVSPRKIGTIFTGKSDKIQLHWANLQTGAGGMTVRLIENIKQKANPNQLTILDSPPGTSCAVVSTIKDADIVVLVADPTRFGIHDLKLSVSLCRSMSIEPLIIINRAQIGDLQDLRKWTEQKQLQILAEIPDSLKIAKLYSTGKLAVEHMPKLKELFADIAIDLLNHKPKPLVVEDIAEQLIFEVSQDAIPVKAATPTSKPFEISVVSGKGGSGKTSLSACFAQLSNSTVADCDVDAADLHLLLEPKVLHKQNFHGGRVMSIDTEKCVSCGKCQNICQFNAINLDGPANDLVAKTFTVDSGSCEGCGACTLVCPTDAIKISQTLDGVSYFSTTRFGNISHATLTPGKENSGRLVTLVRKNATDHANPDDKIVLDGSPGTGCPVIASLGGAKVAVIVTEPTVSGIHDLKRILELAEHFKVPAGIIINKADLNLEQTEKIKTLVKERNATLLGELPYDKIFIDAQQAAQTILEYAPNSSTSQAVKKIWNRISETCIKQS